MALLACVGVDEEGFRKVLAIEVASSEKGAAYASLLRGLLDRGLCGVCLVISDDHEGIKIAVAGELPGGDPVELAAVLFATTHGAVELTLAGHVEEGKGLGDPAKLVHALLAQLRRD